VRISIPAPALDSPVERLGLTVLPTLAHQAGDFQHKLMRIGLCVAKVAARSGRTTTCTGPAIEKSIKIPAMVARRWPSRTSNGLI